MKIKSKIWIEKKGMLIFGSGKSEILRAVMETGSLNKAAKKLNMSYRHAWSYIKSIENRIGKPLLNKIKGGRSGGGAQLTDYAVNLLRKFDCLQRDIAAFADKRFLELFGEEKHGIM